MSVPFRIDRDPRARHAWEEAIVLACIEELRPARVELVPHKTLGPMFASLRTVGQPMRALDAGDLIKAYPGRFKTTKRGGPHKALKDVLERIAARRDSPLRQTRSFGNRGTVYWLRDAA
jgi:hypothetical protein